MGTLKLSRKTLPALIVIALALLCGAAGSVQGQSRDLWFVFVNHNTRPATIGVATSRYNQPGWSKLTSAFGSSGDAWRAACRLHRQPQYHAPDIQQGRVSCASLEAGGGAAPGAAAGNCRGSFLGTWSTTYGQLRIQRSQGNGVVGNYGSGRQIRGRIAGCQLVGEWIYKSGRRGTLTFVLQPDGKSFSGRWSEPGGRQNAGWNGTKQGR